MPRTFAFTGSHRTGLTTTNYLAVVGQETMWPGAKTRKREEIKDGADDTILIVENNGLGVHWMEPRDLVFDSMEFTFDSPNGISSWYEQPSVVTADDAVHMLSPKTTPAGLRAALTVAGGENVPDEERGWTVIRDGRERERKP